MQERPKLKDFGSSLKKLKWDKAKQTTVDTREKPKVDPEVEDVIRIKTDLVVTDVVVLDQHRRMISGLSKDDFLISENNEPQSVAHFGVRSDQAGGRTIVLIIDYSSSMLPYIRMSVEAAKKLLDHLKPNDQMAIVTDDIALLTGFTTDKKKLKKKLDEFAVIASKRFGKSRQWSALLATVKELILEDDIRPIIIFQTDADQVVFLQPPAKNVFRDFIQPFSLQDVFAATEKAGATVYSVIPGIRLLDLPEEEQLRRTKLDLRNAMEMFPLGGLQSVTKEEATEWLERRLRQQESAAALAKLTGGWTSFLERPEQADQIYSDIFADLDSRYVIGYYPTNKDQDGKRRQFKVQIKDHPEYTIWGRNSYRAPVE